MKNKRFLIAVCSAQKYHNRREACRQTWLQNVGPSSRYFFFVGEQPIDGEEPDVVYFNVPDDYGNLIRKVQAMFYFAAACDDFDYLLKCDDDTYLVEERLQSLVENEPDVMGYIWNNSIKSLSGGAGYIISRKHVKALAEELTPTATFEDVEVTLAARRLGIPITGTNRLQCGHGQLPSLKNDKISSHWCNAEKLHEIHRQMRP
ncbi:MAG: hypothetical protein LBV12_00550 [Puniceicoccales bacterium]|jgi:hypothetical protein|nr:hypothetical protein [Puniceicoccales bacterium]